MSKPEAGGQLVLTGKAGTKMIRTNPTDCIVAEGRDPAELSAALSTDDVRITAQSNDRDRFSFRFEYVKADGIVIGFCRYDGTCQIKREGLSNRFQIFLPRYGGTRFIANGLEIPTSSTQGAILDGKINQGADFAGPRGHLFLTIEEVFLRTRLSNLLSIPVSGSLDFRPQIDLVDGPGREVRRIAAALRAGLCDGGPLRSAPVARKNLTEALVSLMLEALPHRFSPWLGRITPALPRHVKRAIEFMRANIGEPLTLQKIAAESGVSGRSLQIGFQQFKMTTPMAYLRYLRLEAMHQDLKTGQPGLEVQETALKWGFTHFGRMAADYCARYGELPSETYKRALTE
ncbi:AraC family transcriptional regulator [Rhizobium chutanense]|nr:AraC family transcriptional regulator [Rhizobium chutanense]